MAKSREKFEARKLRISGLSLMEIADKLEVSKGSVSVWCDDIKLSKKQIRRLHEKMVTGSYEGRMIGANMQKEKKIKKIRECSLKAKKDISTLNHRDLFIAGLGLYWGEGSKKSGVRFYNSDPEAIKFMMEWFREILKIKEDRFLMYININQIHKKRLKSVIEYWSEITGISVGQFRKPSLINVKNKKTYSNFSNHYGTLCIRISKSSTFLYQILEWIKAMNKPG
ncbi:MAG: hypothetical protein M0P97_00690 [Candidatus Moranbacteria bacterium]|jgi:predicted DNA-binding protein YlxM (UPF0122 family)|nr:hypothetical protein [Candidatus Moranbacteria bacterium]